MKYDDVVVSRGPTGCSVDIFAAREQLDTVGFDRDRPSIRRCAPLESYLNLPAGIDVDAFYGLVHNHAGQAGYETYPDSMASVERVSGTHIDEQVSTDCSDEAIEDRPSAGPEVVATHRDPEVIGRETPAEEIGDETLLDESTRQQEPLAETPRDTR